MFFGVIRPFLRGARTRKPMPNPKFKPAHTFFWSKMEIFLTVETQKKTLFFAHGGGGEA